MQVIHAFSSLDSSGVSPALADRCRHSAGLLALMHGYVWIMQSTAIVRCLCPLSRPLRTTAVPCGPGLPPSLQRVVTITLVHRLA